MSVGLYETSKYKAYIYPQKIVICTGIQCFRIVCREKYYFAALDSLKIEMLNGEIESLNDLTFYEGRLIWENCTPPLSQQLVSQLQV